MDDMVRLCVFQFFDVAETPTHGGRTDSIDCCSFDIDCPIADLARFAAALFVIQAVLLLGLTYTRGRTGKVERGS